MRSWKWRAIVFTGMCALVATVILSAKTNPAGKVLIYANGETTQVPQQDPRYPNISKVALYTLEKATTTLLELVTDKMITQAKQEDLAVEVVMRSPQDVTLSNGSITKLDRVLVVVRGAHYQGWVFYGNQKYSSGPYVAEGNDLGQLEIKLQKP